MVFHSFQSHVLSVLDLFQLAIVSSEAFFILDGIVNLETLQSFSGSLLMATWIYEKLLCNLGLIFDIL